MGLTPRPYQLAGDYEIQARIASGCKRILLVAPTGAGKTACASMQLRRCAEAGVPALFLAHRQELVRQCSAKLTECGIPHGVIMSGAQRLDPLALVQVASVPTLLARKLTPPADYVILDEARLHRAEQTEKLLRHYRDSILIGLDATPVRSDGKGLKDLFDELVLLARPRELIDQGYLVDYDGFSYDDPHRDLSGVKVHKGDYNSRQLSRVMASTSIVGDIVGKYLEHADGKRAVYFAASIERSKELAAKFVDAGVNALHLDEKSPQKTRIAAYELLALGAVQVIVNVGLLGYGVDIPSIEVVGLCRPTLSVATYLQQLGRGMRPSPSTGKTRLRIHDHAGCLMTLGLPDEDRVWTLDDDSNVREPFKLPTQKCSRCQRAYRGRVCPFCFPATTDAHSDEQDGPLVSIEDLRKPTTEGMQASLKALVSTSQRTGKDARWVVDEFRKAWGRVPDWRWL